MRIVFMGTPDFSVRVLEACFSLGEVVSVVTQPDKPKGRGQEMAVSPVKALATARGVAVLQPPKLRGTDFAATLKKLSPDVSVVAAYGKILPKDVLEAPRLGSVNVHASLLPRWRGASPIQRAIQAGDPVSGVTLMRMDEGMDTGPTFARREVPLAADETGATLHDKLAAAGASLLADSLRGFVAGELVPVAQPPEGITMAPMLKKEEGELDFAQAAAELEQKVRAFTPWPGTYTFFGGGLLKVHRARDGAGAGAPGTVLAVGEVLEVACGQGSLGITELQAEGRKRMSAAEFVAGRKIAPGDRPFGRMASR